MMLDIKKVKTYPLLKRKNKVNTKNFSRLYIKQSGINGLRMSLPRILAAKDLMDIVADIVSAHKRKKPVIFMMGAHVIKCGLNPIIIDLLKRNIISTIALSGAGLIHDFETALIGSTSEDVASALEDGSFGMADETARYINAAIKEGAKRNMGMGKSIGNFIIARKKQFPFKELSILYNASVKKIPVTIHVGIGTDIIHQHPSCDGASLGKTSLADFHLLANIISGLEGGVVINWGSAVILPEVFLKALNIARNLGHRVRKFTAVDFDMIRHYRPTQNVIARPTTLGGRGYAITGHHEIMLPLLAAFLIEELGT
ncbi:MAG: hypothetical protein V1893_02320 [Candidatus Omnitrophota bacterium]